MKKLTLLTLVAVAVFFTQVVSAKADCVAGDTTAPTMVVDLRVSAIAATGIIYSFTVPQDASSLEEIDLRLSSAPLNTRSWASATQVSGEPKPSTSGTLQSVNLDGLSPSVSSYMALKVKDACGKWSAMSNVVNFTTIAQAKPTLVMEWAFTPSDGKELLEYKIDYDLISASDPTGSLFTRFTNSLDKQATFMVDPGSYVFRVSARYTDGTESPPSPDFPFTAQ